MPGRPEAGLARTSGAAALDRIAEALRLPLDAFYDREDGEAASQRQLADLVAAFIAIEDPVARQKCVMFVRAATGRFSIDDELR